MNGEWKLFEVEVELTRRGSVFVVATDKEAAITIATEGLEEDWLGEADLDYGPVSERAVTEQEVLEISRDRWAGAPLLQDGAPDELDVDMKLLAAAFAGLDEDREARATTPGTLEYCANIEAAGQQLLALDGVRRIA